MPETLPAMPTLTPFQTRHTADAAAVEAAFTSAGYPAQRSRHRFHPALTASGHHAGRPVTIDARWTLGQRTDIPIFTVTLSAPLGGAVLRARRHINADRAPIRVPGDATIAVHGAPQAALINAMQGELGDALASVAQASDYLNALTAENDTVTLRLSGWPPTAHEVAAAVKLCALTADVLAAAAPGHEAEGAAFLADEAAALRRSRRVALALLAVFATPVVATTVLFMPV